MNLKKNYIINAIFLCLILVFDVIYMNKVGIAYFTKGSASVLFVLCGLFNFYVCKKYTQNTFSKYNLFVLIGLVFACLGDIFLIDFFIIGAGLFAVGHLFFFVAFCKLCKINVLDIVVSLGLIAFSLCIILIPNIYDFNGLMMVIVVYSIIISVMLGKSIANIFRVKCLNKLQLFTILIGATLFYFSDFMLLLNMFTSLGNGIFDILCLGTYYPAVFILAISMSVLNNIAISKTQSNK